MASEISARSVHGWEWPLHNGIDLTLLHPEAPFLEGHRLMTMAAVYSEAALEEMSGWKLCLVRGSVRPSAQGPWLLSTPLPSKLSLPLSILVFNILFERGKKKRRVVSMS